MVNISPGDGLFANKKLHDLIQVHCEGVESYRNWEC